MKRLFIIGAGFSKAIANAPLANGFIRAIYDRVLKEDENHQHPGDWPHDRNCFIKLLRYFHESAIPLINWLEKNNDKKILNRDFEEFLNSLNIEFVCSFLDLHKKHYFISEAKGVDLQGCPIPYIHGFHKSELESALKFIMHHMLDLLLKENLEVNSTLFDKMSSYFQKEDMIINFNYDLLVDKMLWQKQLWNPFDGYGFEFDKGENKNVLKSKIQMIKIHGSINWRSPDIFFHPNLELAIDHPFKDEPLFEGLKIPKSLYDKEKYRQYPLYSHVILPTFAKSPQYIWEMQLINNSINFCRTADEIYILGYSVPDADYITNLLFLEMNKDAKINIILWDRHNNAAVQLGERLIKKYGFKDKNMVYENTPIEKWIENDFNFITYDEYLKEQADIEQMCLSR